MTNLHLYENEFLDRVGERGRGKGGREKREHYKRYFRCVSVNMECSDLSSLVEN